MNKEKIDISKYEDIIEFSRPISKTRSPMSMKDRAGQFAPFAALTGHKESIEETGRYVDKKIELDDNAKEILNYNMQIIINKINEHPNIRVCYFLPDSRKVGGTYISVEDILIKYDRHKNQLITDSKKIIPLENILEIELVKKNL